MKPTTHLVLYELREYIQQHDTMPSFRQLADKCWYKSPRSIAIAYDDLMDNGILMKEGNWYILKELKEDYEWKSFTWNADDILNILNSMNPISKIVTGGNGSFTIFYK